MAKIFIYTLWEVLPFVLNFCAITCWCLLSIVLKETVIILSSPWRCIIFPLHLCCDVFFVIFPALWRKKSLFISLSLDWSDHCPSFTMMTDQQIRKQGWIIVPLVCPFQNEGKNTIQWFILAFGALFTCSGCAWKCWISEPPEAIPVQKSRIAYRIPQYAQIGKTQP